MNQWLKVFYDDVRLHHLLKLLIMKIKRKYSLFFFILSNLILFFYFRPLDIAKKNQMSPSIIDILFSLSGRL